MYFVVAKEGKIHGFTFKCNAETWAMKLINEDGYAKEDISIYYGKQLQLIHSVEIVEEKKEC